jgi:hypothetical protein
MSEVFIVRQTGDRFEVFDTTNKRVLLRTRSEQLARVRAARLAETMLRIRQSPPPIAARRGAPVRVIRWK